MFNGLVGIVQGQFLVSAACIIKGRLPVGGRLRLGRRLPFFGRRHIVRLRDHGILRNSGRSRIGGLVHFPEPDESEQSRRGDHDDCDKKENDRPPSPPVGLIRTTPFCVFLRSRCNGFPFQRGDEIGTGVEAHCRIFAQGAFNGRLHVFRLRRDRGRRLVQHGFAKHGHIRAFERQTSGEQFVDHHGQSILVRRGSLRLTAPLFRGHVGGSPAGSRRDQADARHAEVNLRSETEIQHLDMPARDDHDVSGLDVAVNDHFLVRIIQRRSDLTDDRQDRFESQVVFVAFPANPAPQILSLDTIHDQIIVSVGIVLFERVGACDVRMMKFMDELEVILHIFHFQLAVGEFRRQGFQSDRDPRNVVEALVNHAHAALPELGQDPVAPEDHIADAKPAVGLALPFARHGRIDVGCAFISPLSSPLRRDRHVEVGRSSPGIGRRAAGWRIAGNAPRFDHASVFGDSKFRTAFALIFSRFTVVFRTA